MHILSTILVLLIKVHQKTIEFVVRCLRNVSMNKIINSFYQKVYKSKIKRLVSPYKKNIKNNTITILKYDGIGDFILFLDAAKGLRNFYANKKIILSCPISVREIAKKTGCFDEIIVFRKNEFRFSKLKVAKKKASLLDCETLLHLSFSRDFTSEILASFIKANKKISVPYSYVFSAQDAKWTHSLYDVFLNVPLNIMCLQQNKLVLQELGDKDFKSAFPILPPIKNAHLFLPHNYFVLFVGGSTRIKKWNIEKYYTVVEYINSVADYKCILAGTEDDLEQESFFMNGNIEYYSYIGKTSLEELQTLISHAKFVIGNDTSAIHMAAALNVPSLCISSSASSNRFYPYVVDNVEHGCAPICIKSPCECEGCSFSPDTFLKCMSSSEKKFIKKCIADIEVKNVIKQVDILLGICKEKNNKKQRR